MNNHQKNISIESACQYLEVDKRGFLKNALVLLILKKIVRNREIGPEVGWWETQQNSRKSLRRLTNLLSDVPPKSLGNHQKR
jgi:hypothetical protein